MACEDEEAAVLAAEVLLVVAQVNKLVADVQLMTCQMENMDEPPGMLKAVKQWTAQAKKASAAFTGQSLRADQPNSQ